MLKACLIQPSVRDRTSLVKAKAIVFILGLGKYWKVVIRKIIQ